jgi:predicted phage baseplate assembly protein
VAVNPFSCLDDRRRDRARRAPGPGPNGLDTVVVATPTTLKVTLLRPWGAVAPGPLDKAQVTLLGLRPPRVKSVGGWTNDAERGVVFTVTLDRPLDPGPYSLRLGPPAPAGFDPQLTAVRFSYRPNADARDQDCRPDGCPPLGPAGGAPVIDYLAKDYAGFRRLMLDRLAQTLPDWTERRPMDLGVTVVEVLAYAADHLSYFQDAVATEAYLQTARRRLSVRRHARLVDYAMHDGCNARTWVAVTVFDAVEPDGLVFFTDPTAYAPAVARRPVSSAADLEQPVESDRVVFEPVAAAFRPTAKPEHRRLFPSRNEIRFYTWGDGECCLPKGATGATLEFQPEWREDIGERPRPGDLLLLEEVIGPDTGLPADADPKHRHVVRLTRVAAVEDPTPPSGPAPVSVLEVAWDTADALPFSLCISKGRFGGPADPLSPVSVARGNVLLVDQGLSVSDRVGPLPGPQPLRPKAGPSACAAPRPTQGSAPELAPAAEHWPRTARYEPLPRAPVTQAAVFPDPHARARLLARRLARWARDVLRTWLGNAARHYATGPGRARFVAAARDVTDRIDRLVARARAGVFPEDADWAGLTGAIDTVQYGNAPSPLADLDLIGPAADDLRQDVRAALPVLTLAPAADLWPPQADPGPVWTPLRDLLASGPGDRHFVVEVDDDDTAWLRFGDGLTGAAPPPRQAFQAALRLGNGSAGNVAADTVIGCVSHAGAAVGVSAVRNPLPASGGTDPEPAETAKLLAPSAFLTEPRRAVTADDYARLAERDDRVQRAAATLLWAGTGSVVAVAVDLLATALEVNDPAEEERLICAEIAEGLRHYRRIGHQVTVAPARTVPLRVRMVVRLRPAALRAKVLAALRAVLGPGELPGGGRGLFHPDNLTFGQPVIGSALVAAAQKAKGVDSVSLAELRRRDAPGPALPADGVLRVGPLEVARLDADPAAPGHGELVLEAEGGR